MRWLIHALWFARAALDWAAPFSHTLAAETLDGPSAFYWFGVQQGQMSGANMMTTNNTLIAMRYIRATLPFDGSFRHLPLAAWRRARPTRHVRRDGQ